MLHMRSKLIFVLVVVFSLMGCAGMQSGDSDDALENARKAGLVSYSVYMNVLKQYSMTAQMIVPKVQSGTATEAEMKVFEILKPMGKVLTRYAEAHNIYADAIDVWRMTGEKPENMEEVLIKIDTLVAEITNLAIQIGFDIANR